MPSKQKQAQTLQWCLEHLKNGVYATLNMVQHAIAQRTACCVPEMNTHLAKYNAAAA